MYTTDPRTKFDQLLDRVTYPTDTAAVVEFMRSHGTGDDVVALAQRLKPRTFASSAEVRAALDAKS